MPHLIVTGPESTGKTTLSQQLAAHYGGVWVPEYPRGFLEAAGRAAVAGDFAHFVRADQQLVAAAKRHDDGAAVVVQDTGLEVLGLWYEDKFGPHPGYLTEALGDCCPDIYVLCRPDLPWAYDPLREDPHRRDELYVKLRRSIEGLGCFFVEVGGFDESRLRNALAALSNLRLDA